MKKLIWIVPALLFLIASILVIRSGHDAATVLVQMYLILGLAGLITGDIMNDPRKKKREDIEEFDWELEDKKYD